MKGGTRMRDDVIVSLPLFKHLLVLENVVFCAVLIGGQALRLSRTLARCLSNILCWYVSKAGPSTSPLPPLPIKPFYSVMHNSVWYATAIGAIAALFLCFYLRKKLIYFIDFFITSYCLKNIYYRRICTHLRWSNTTTWFHGLLVGIFLAGNATYLVINREQLLQQSGVLSVVNLIPVALGGHMNLIVDVCGITLEDYNRMHRWVARVAVIEGLLHSVLAVASQPPNLHKPGEVAAVVAAPAMMVALAIASISLFWRRFYETFLRVHQALAAVLVIGIGLHIPRGFFKIPAMYLLIACCAWLGLRLVRVIAILFRNFWNGGFPSHAVIWSVPDAVHVHVKVARPWDYRAGQFLYLCLPGVSWMQSHPYSVSWWYTDNKGHNVIVLIISCQRGFSRTLCEHSSGNLILGTTQKKDKSPRLLLATDPGGRPGKELLALVEGPYGQGVRLGEYGTVLLCATGIGIAAILPLIKQFLDEFHNWDVKARKIALYWEVDSERHLLWTGNWMTELLSQDTEYIINIYVYITGDYVTPGVTHGAEGDGGKHGRIKLRYRALDIEDVTRAELRVRRGRSLVLLCVRGSVGNDARQSVRKMMVGAEEEIRLIELPFKPRFASALGDTSTYIPLLNLKNALSNPQFRAMDDQLRAQVAAQDQRIYHEKKSKHRGTALVDLSGLQFGFEISNPKAVQFSKKKVVKKLVTNFNLEGCHPLDDECHVSALISTHELQEAVDRSNISIDALRSDTPPPKLIIPSSRPLRCLYGRHRVQAAGQHRQGWWVVDLYSDDSSTELQTHLREGFSNATNFCDGEILRHIFLYQGNDKLNEMKWWARLSPDKRRDLKFILRIPGFPEVFAALMTITGLWPPFHIGTFRRYATLNCPEQLLTYLRRILAVFSFIADCNSEIMQQIDPATVEAIQLRAPLVSTQDAAFINDQMASGTLFHSVTDPSAREKIRCNIMRVDHLIPSLSTFCEDTKYLEPCAITMKLLVKLQPRETIDRAFFRIWTRPDGPFIRQDGEQHFTPIEGDEASRFRYSLLQLFLMCMRGFPQMVNIACRKDVEDVKPAVTEPNSITIYRLAAFAHKLGFDSEEIRNLLASDPEVQEMCICLNRLESDGEADEAQLKSDARELLHLWQAQKGRRSNATSASEPKPILAIDTVDQQLLQRCGRPFNRAHKCDKRFLFLRWIYETSESRGRYITSFFVKRSIFVSFFGEGAASGPTLVKPHLPENAATGLITKNAQQLPECATALVLQGDGYGSPMEGASTTSSPAVNAIAGDDIEMPDNRDYAQVTPEKAIFIEGGPASMEVDFTESGVIKAEKAIFIEEGGSARREVDFTESEVMAAASTFASERYRLIYKGNGHQSIVLPKQCYHAMRDGLRREIWCRILPQDVDRVEEYAGKTRKVNDLGTGKKFLQITFQDNVETGADDEEELYHPPTPPSSKPEVPIHTGATPKSAPPNRAKRQRALDERDPPEGKAEPTGQLRHGDPWSLYSPAVYLDEAGDVTGAYSRQGLVRLIIRTSTRFGGERIHDLLQIRHKHIVPLYDAFQSTETYLVYEMMHISLDVLIGCDLALREPQVAKICSELLQAICYLASKGLVHGNLISSNVLFNRSGETRLGSVYHRSIKPKANLPTSARVHDSTHAQPASTSSSRDVWSLGRLMLEMVEPWNTIVPDFEVGDTLKFSNPGDWSAEATDFLRNTSTVSAQDLTAHGFLRRIDSDDSGLEANMWLGNLTVMKLWTPIIE
ncbi:uncharacterized protein BP5553_10473 [Venustampulla echinocandica]|uniref:ferric-chelate reductase (NADPH) n=1 Tax=Venustampulla echinocandica TaxID=2656787 RepID=A0A370T9E7_9HELO|nr:uncharacterized protein BP5553_10473 [Venustampulla echinocandica]RDL30195.1 hypothetical protein BP5553_10473 [Venustampulla echinocandica]